MARVCFQCVELDRYFNDEGTNPLRAPGVDFDERRPTYSKLVSLTHASRVVSTVVALAVALIGLLPFAHLHADEHQQVLHRHVIDDDGHHGGADEYASNIDHSEHAGARILSVSWLTGIAFALTAPVPMAAQLAAQPRCGRVTVMLGTTILPTHDPPLRFTSSPAPPAVV